MPTLTVRSKPPATSAFRTFPNVFAPSPGPSGCAIEKTLVRNVLLLVHQDAGQEARLRAALDVTRAISGHLTRLDMTSPPLVYDQGMAMAPAVLIDEADEETANKVELRQRLRTRTSGGPGATSTMTSSPVCVRQSRGPT